MGQLVVRDIEDSVKARIQRRAQRNRRSMEAEVRDILRNAANEPDRPAIGLGTDLANMFRGKGYDLKVKELRGHPVTPADFDGTADQ